MAATIGVSSAGSHPRTQSGPFPKAKRRRRIDLQAGRALEILGHAIEYLTDEYIHKAPLVSAHDPEVEAIQLMMAINREVYLECPIVPTIGERLRGWFGLHAHS